MIFIDIVEPVKDRTWSRWRRDCDKETSQIKKDVNAGKSPDVKKLYKRKSVKDKFYFRVTGLFGGKCAYCETYLLDFQNPDIEHYRPKLGVTDENDLPIMVDYGSGEVEHKGYFWLAYDWHNLLPSCAKCNQASSTEDEKIGKHNRFPVAGEYARFEEEIPTERPLLLNPLQEDPALFLKVNTKDGMLEARDTSPSRGAMTIRVLGLNVRDQLRRRRLGKIREVKLLLASVIHNPENSDEILSELKAMRNGEGEYTLAVRGILDELAPKLGALFS